MVSDALLMEAERIKARLNACTTQGDVRKVADEERTAVQAMYKEGGDSRTMAIQIVNLKEYRLRGVKG